MGDKSKIEWLRGADGSLGASWNAIRARNKATGGVGHFCIHKTAACANCYAERLQPRFQNPVRYAAQDRDKVELFLDRDKLREPLRWKRPRLIFVCSMTDLFLLDHPTEWIAEHYAVMALCPQHVFIVLTKRGVRQRAMLISPAFVEAVETAMDRIAPAHWCARGLQDYGGWPLRNVWAGVSCHDQPSADEIVPQLLATPAAVRFVSAEPLLGPTDLDDIKWPADHARFPESDDVSDSRSALRLIEGTKLDWVICGGESGDDVRPMHPDWARALRDQCAAAGVPFFFKQWGTWAPATDHYPDMAVDYRLPDGGHMCDVGKKAAGRMLDGREWNDMPQGIPFGGAIGGLL